MPLLIRSGQNDGLQGAPHRRIPLQRGNETKRRSTAPKTLEIPFQVFVGVRILTSDIHRDGDMNPPELGAFDFRETVRHGPMMPTPRVFVIRFWLLTKVNWQHPCGQPVALFSLTKGQASLTYGNIS